MWNGLPVTVESASAVRRIWPPPSPDEPSIVNTESSFHANDLVQSMHELDEILLVRAGRETARALNFRRCELIRA